MLNERALQLANDMATRAAGLRIGVEQTPADARILDCGIKAQGGLQAGLALAGVTLAGLAEVSLAAGEAGGVPCPVVQVTSDHPVMACLASQYAGWSIQLGRFSAMGSGPMRALWGREELFDTIGGREHADVAVGMLESTKFPPDDATAYLCDQLRLAADKLTLLVAPAASLAGTVQVVARSLETALHKLHQLRFDLGQVVTGFGSAPLPPVAAKELQAIGRTNDAILYGGRVVLWVNADDDELITVGPKVPSCSSSDHGSLFVEIYERCGMDFYKIDPMLFSPAMICFNNLRSGRSHVFGRIEDEVLRRSFGD